MNTSIKIIVNIVLFVLFMFLIITGQKEQTMGHLMKMIVGLFGLILLLWKYNRGHK